MPVSLYPVNFSLRIINIPSKEIQFYHPKHLIIFRKVGGMRENEYEQIKYIHTNNKEIELTLH